VVVNNALDRIGVLFGSQLVWEPTKPFQELILRHTPNASVIARTLSAEQLFGVASHECEFVNRFLREKGFGSIQLQDYGSGRDKAYVASIIKLLGDWLVMGEKGFKLPVVKVPAFRLDASCGLSHYISKGQRLVRIPTTSRFDMWVSQTCDAASFDQIDFWIDLISNSKNAVGNGAVLPFVDIKQAKVDIKDLIGMRAGNVIIQQALAAANFKLTNTGVSFEMAVAMSGLRYATDLEEPKAGDFVVGRSLNFALVRRQEPLMPLAVGSVSSDEYSHTSDIS
jgi:hypothetical protein